MPAGSRCESHPARAERDQYGLLAECAQRAARYRFGPIDWNVKRAIDVETLVSDGLGVGHPRANGEGIDAAAPVTIA